MSKKRIAFVCFILFFWNSLNSYAQNTPMNKQSLTKILNFIEENYNIWFSFADETIVNKYAFLPDSTLSLNEVLLQLELETALDFELLSDKFVIIKTTETAVNSFKTQFLKEIVIHKYLASGLSKNNTGLVTIRPEKLGILPGLIEPDVLQTIQALPGVISVDETVSNINIRGGTHDQNLMLWEGIKMYQSGHFFGLISAFNPYLTNKVNVSKNGTSAQYGDGVSSVIDMQLSNTTENKFKAGSGFNLVHADAFIKVPISKKITFQFAARRSFTDFITALTYKQYFKRIFQDSDFTNNQESQNNTISKNENFYFYDLTGKILFDISKKDKIRISFLTINNNLNYEEQATITNTEESLNSNLTQRNIAGGISYIKNWNNSLETTAQVYFSKYNLDAKNFDILNNQRLIQENKVFDSAIKLNTKWLLNKNTNLQIGYQFFEVGISNLEDVNNPLFRSYIKEVIRSHAIYTEGQLLSKSLNTNIKAGVRLNYIPKFNTFLAEPRISFSQRFTDNFRVEFLGEFKSQTTSQIIDLQNDFLGIEKHRWVLANNADIPIIKSKQASLGLHYNSKKVLLSAEAFYKYVDGITSRSQGFQNQFQFVKAIGNYQVKGVDFLINKQFNKLNSWLSYSFTKNDYTFNALNNGNKFPNNADIAHAVTFSNTYTLNKLKLALGVNWHSGKPFTKPNDQNPILNGNINYVSPNSSNLKDYLRVDFSATHAFNISKSIKAEAGVSIWNILNTNNTLNTYYTLDADKNVLKVKNQSLGFTPNISLRVLF